MAVKSPHRRTPPPNPVGLRGWRLRPQAPALLLPLMFGLMSGFCSAFSFPNFVGLDSHVNLRDQIRSLEKHILLISDVHESCYCFVVVPKDWKFNLVRAALTDSIRGSRGWQSHSIALFSIKMHFRSSLHRYRINTSLLLAQNYLEVTWRTKPISIQHSLISWFRL